MICMYVCGGVRAAKAALVPHARASSRDVRMNFCRWYTVGNGGSTGSCLIQQWLVVGH